MCLARPAQLSKPARRAARADNIGPAKQDLSSERENLVPETANVLVETVQVDSAGNRQIATRTRATSLLQDRRGDIEAAVREASAIVQDSVADVEDRDGWRLKSIEAKFGLVLTAEAGVILTRASAEASFEVTVTIERG
jgi:hypothetical protein